MIIVIILSLYFLSFIQNNQENITGLATKKGPSITEPFRLCKLKASNDYTECMKNRIYNSKTETKACHKQYTKSINKCIAERDNKKRRKYLD